MTQTEPTGCVVCQRAGRIPRRPPVCEGCRAKLASQLRELPDLYALLPAALEPGDNMTERVSGTREAPIPVSVDVLDLLADARQPNPTPQAREHPEDQTGHMSVASILDQWVRDWRDLRAKGESLPVPTVATLANWLRVRLDWACDHHPAIDEFAREIGRLMSTMRVALVLRRHIDRLPAPCPTCDMLTLYRESGSDWVECGNCYRLWSPDEYRRLVVVLDEEIRRSAKRGNVA